MDALSLPGGDAIGENSPNLLDALNREQGRLGNLRAGEQFSLAGGGKSIKAIFAMAEEDDDDDFFKEFGVEDLDIEQTDAEPPPSSAGAHQPSTEDMDAAAEAGAPPDLPSNNTGPKGMAPVAESLQRDPSPQDVPHAAAQAKTPPDFTTNSTAPKGTAPSAELLQRDPSPQDITHAAEEADGMRAVLQEDLSYSTEDKPAAASTGGTTLQHDTMMQDASEATAAGAVQHAAPEQVILNMQAVCEKQQGAHHDAQGHAGGEGERQMQHLMQAGRQPVGTENATADTLMQEASQPPHAQQAAPVCTDTCMQDTVDTADGGTDNAYCADPSMQDASQPDDEPQQHSTRAVVEDVHITEEPPLGQQECMPMHEAALSADIMGLQSANRGAEEAPMAPVAAAALQCNAMQSEVIVPGMSAESAPQDAMRPSSAGTVMADMQLAPVAAETLARSASAPLLSKDCVEAASTETIASEEQHAATHEGSLMPEKPSTDAAMHQASAQQELPQQQPADLPTVHPDPVQQQAGVVPQMRQPQTTSQEQPPGLRAVPIQPGQPLGSSVLAPSLQPHTATPYSAAPGVKVFPRVLPMPRTGLARLPQIIRPYAPAVQLPASAAMAATHRPRAPSPSPAQPFSLPPVSGAPANAPLSASPQPLSMLQISAAPAWAGTPAASASPAQPSSTPPVSTAPITAPFPGFNQAFSATPVVPTADTQVASSALPSPETLCDMGMSQPRAACTKDQAEQVAPAQPEDLPELHTLNLELLKSQRKLEQMLEEAQHMTDQALELQMLEEAQHMTDQALELQVMAAILGNRLTRLNNPMLAAKLKEMKQRAEAIMAPED